MRPHSKPDRARLVRWAFAFLLLLAALALAMNWSQDAIIFPTHAVSAPGPLPIGAERLQVKTPDGETLHGVHIAAADRSSAAKLLVLGFGGNAWNGQDVATYLREVYPQAEVVVFHYRGYRPSTGTPSAKALLADAPLAFDAAVERVKPDRVVVAGFSIGSGIAASVAKQRPADGLILVTPFDSLKKVARDAFPWLPVGLFFQHEIDAEGFLEGSTVPVAIIGAEEDEIIPSARTDALRRRVPNLAFDRTIAAAGHNDVYARSEFQEAMDEALEALLNR